MTPPESRIVVDYDQLKYLLNQDVALTAYLEVAQESVDRFADLSFDHQWIHVDPQRAKAESPFRGTISHGLFNLSMAAHFLMSGVKMRCVRYGLVTELRYARFLSAVPVGSLIRGRMRLMHCERLQNADQAIWMVTVERKGGVLPACVAEFVVRYYG